MVADPPPRVVLVDRAGLDEVAQHLGDEEGVAVGLAIHGVREAEPGIVEPMARGRFQQLHHAMVVEAAQIDVVRSSSWRHKAAMVSTSV